MKILKIILFAVLGMVAIALISAAVVKKDYAVERSITINKPKGEVFNYVKFLKNQGNFSKWAMMDPSMKKSFTGEDGKVGFISAWESDNKELGVGEQEIKKITEGERIDFELRFKKPFEATEQAYLSTEDAGNNSTTVKWGFNGHMPYPMNLMLVFMNMDKMIGADLATGLSNLKVVMEK